MYRTSYPGGKDDIFTVSWFPFYLDPTSPKVGMPMQQRMAEKFGASRLPAPAAPPIPQHDPNDHSTGDA